MGLCEFDALVVRKETRNRSNVRSSTIQSPVFAQAYEIQAARKRKAHSCLGNKTPVLCLKRMEDTDYASTSKPTTTENVESTESSESKSDSSDFIDSNSSDDDFLPVKKKACRCKKRKVTGKRKSAISVVSNTLSYGNTIYDRRFSESG